MFQGQFWDEHQFHFSYLSHNKWYAPGPFNSVKYSIYNPDQQMDIFKLIYDHDLRLDDLRKRHTNRSSQDLTLSIEDFMKPDPTYSKFYLTGSRPDLEKFGLSTLSHFQEIIEKIQHTLPEYLYFSESGSHTDLCELLENLEIGEAVVLSKGHIPAEAIEHLHIHNDSNVGHKKAPLREALLDGNLVLYKEKAHHGYDLHLFSKENIYKSLFFPLKNMLSNDFRFFSINGKRIQSERKFYFETWALEMPPHGVEEVHPDTVL
jgi:hypothetical protein